MEKTMIGVRPKAVGKACAGESSQRARQQIDRRNVACVGQRVALLQCQIERQELREVTCTIDRITTRKNRWSATPHRAQWSEIEVKPRPPLLARSMRR